MGEGGEELTRTPHAVILYWVPTQRCYNLENMSGSPSLTNQTTQKVLRHLFDNGAFAWRANSTGIYDPTLQKWRTSPKKGVSDILGCLPGGRFLAIEIKTGKDRLSPEQTGFILSVQHAGGTALVVKDYDDYLDQISQLLTFPQ